MYVLEVVQQRRPAVPIGVRRALHDVVALERASRYERDVVDIQPGGVVLEIGADLLESALVPVHQVHFVDDQAEVPDAEERGDKGVAAGLFCDAVAGVDQHDREVRGRGAGRHVAGVLHVPGAVGDDELTPGRGEVPVRDVDGDALLALGPEAVGQQCEVRALAAAAQRGLLHGVDLVFEHRLGVVEQAPDERGLAVVHTAAGEQAEQVHAEVGVTVEGWCERGRH